MTDAPSWFSTAVAVQPTARRIAVAGAEVNYLSWGEPHRPGIVFVHGGAAHAHWWSHVAPAFLPDHSVAAIDLSGHGDSDRREEYSLDTWCDEVAAVIADAGFDGPPILIGHSMGGFVTIATAARHPELLAGAVIIDSPVVEMDPEVTVARATDMFSKEREYDDPRGPIERFRTIPPQDVYLPYVKRHIAEHSLRQDPDGKWRWKFDSAIFVPRRRDAAELLPQITCRVALLRCEHGLVTADIGDYMYNQLGRVAPVIELPTAGHHPMLDVPLILITAIRSLIADWDHSRPLRRR
jgi:pimeloyl-ACP methyl ester carboxylesterase